MEAKVLLLGTGLLVAEVFLLGLTLITLSPDILSWFIIYKASVLQFKTMILKILGIGSPYKAVQKFARLRPFCTTQTSKHVFSKQAYGFVRKWGWYSVYELSSNRIAASEIFLNTQDQLCGPQTLQKFPAIFTSIIIFQKFILNYIPLLAAPVALSMIERAVIQKIWGVANASFYSIPFRQTRRRSQLFASTKSYMYLQSNTRYNSGKLYQVIGVGLRSLREKWGSSRCPQTSGLLTTARCIS